MLKEELFEDVLFEIPVAFYVMLVEAAAVVELLAVPLLLWEPSVELLVNEELSAETV